MHKLQVKRLFVDTVDGKPILSDISLEFETSKRYALIGPNGSGKSTLVNALMGHPHYRITKGQILLNGHDITKLPTDQRAKLGLFLGFQYPVEVEGVSFSSFLRLATHHQDSNRTNFLDTLETMERQAKQLGFKNFDHTRSLGVGFSGGEKKRSEILQMLALRPKFAFLDEPDSGLDADGLNALAGTLNKLDFPTALVLISHHHKALDTFRPDIVHVLKSGKLVASGGAEVLQQIQKNGFKGL